MEEKEIEYYYPNKLGIVGVKEISDLFGVPLKTANQWRTRDALPVPDSYVSGVPVWTITKMVTWAIQTGRQMMLEEQDLEKFLPKELARAKRR